MKAQILSRMIERFTYKTDIKSRYYSYLHHRILQLNRKAYSALKSNYLSVKSKENYIQDKKDIKCQGGVFYGWFEAASRRINVKNRLL